MDENLKMRKRNLIAYPLGTVGRDGIYQLFTNFLLTFVLLTKGLDIAQISVITVIMVIARVFDAVNDPVMGYIIERTRTRWGKFKPWLAIGMVTTSLVVISIFTSPFTGWGFVVHFGIAYFLYSITYTMHDISYWGMVPALSSDADTRNNLTSRAILCAGIGGTLLSMLVPMLTVGSNPVGGSAKTAFGIVSIVVCVIALIFISVTIFGVIEPNPHGEKKEGESKKHASIKDVVGTVLKNRPLMWMVIIFLIQQIGNGLIGGGVGSMYVYFSYGYEGGLYSLFSTIGVAATAVLMVIYPIISKKFERKQIMKFMMLVSAVGYILMIAIGIIGTGLPNMVSFWLMTIGYMLSNFGQYGFYLVMMISILNTVEYNEYHSGHREEAIITSTRPFLTKLASAIIIAFTSITYIICRVTDVTNSIQTIDTNVELTAEEKALEISNLLNGVDSSQKLLMLLLMTIVPFVLMFISFILYMKKYELTEKEYDRIVEELRVRHEKFPGLDGLPTEEMEMEYAKAHSNSTPEPPIEEPQEGKEE